MLSGSGGLGGGKAAQWSKPAALVCHICGREYGTTSLKIHIPQCEKMWVQREAQKDRKDRRPVPKPSSAMGAGSFNLRSSEGMAAYNEAATKEFSERALVACPNCGRTFFEDRLAIHLRSCRPGNEAARVGTGRIKSASEAVAAATPQKANGPGQTYGGGASTTLSPSATSVLKKLSPSAGSKPRGAGVSFADSASSGPSTARPRAAPVKAASGGSWEDELNDELDDAPQQGVPSKAYAIPADDGAEDGELAGCSLCGRNFNVDRLAKHESVCRKQQASNAKRAKRIAAKQAKLPEPGSQKSAGTDAWKSKHNEFQNAIQYAKKLTAMQKAGHSLASLPPPPRSENADYVTCPHCDRRFNQNAAARHIPACANTINKPKAVPRNGPTKPPAAGSMAAQRAAKAASAAPPVARQASTQGYGMAGGGGGYGAPPSGAYGGGGMSGGGYGASSAGGYGQYGDDYGSPPSRPGTSSQRPGTSSQRPTTSGGGRAAPPGIRPAAPRAAAPMQARPSAQRSPSSMHSGGGGGGGDQALHSKINQLTKTVEQLSKVVLSPPGGRGGGSTCRSCGESNPVAAARFCPSCGARS